MKTIHIVVTIVIACVAGVLLAAVVPYARTHFSMTSRVLIICAAYLICFGLLLIFRKIRKQEVISRRDVTWFALASGITITALALYEQHQQNISRLWIAIGLLAIAVPAAVIRTSAKLQRLTWIFITLTGAIVLWWIVR